MKHTGDGFLGIVAADCDIAEGVVVIVKPFDGSIYLHCRLLMLGPLALKSQECGHLSQLVIGQYLFQVQVLGSYGAIKLSGSIHSHLHIDVACSGLEEGFQCDISLTIPVKKAA